MNVSAWITLFGISVAAIVALSVASMHRKQMRQIELHRADPSVPVTPPPHRTTLFIKRNWLVLWCLLFGAYDLVLLLTHLNQTTPVTRRVVYDLITDVLGVASMVAVALADLTLRGTSRALSVLERMIDVMGAMSEELKSLRK